MTVLILVTEVSIAATVVVVFASPIATAALVRSRRNECPFAGVPLLPPAGLGPDPNG